jgi:hypothetical protein
MSFNETYSYTYEFLWTKLFLAKSWPNYQKLLLPDTPTEDETLQLALDVH